MVLSNPEALIVPSAPMIILVPCLTPPRVKPSTVGASNLIVPVVVIALPVAGAPKPAPGMIEVTVPLFTVVTYPPDETERPVLGIMTPGVVLVATGKETPGKV